MKKKTLDHDHEANYSLKT